MAQILNYRKFHSEKKNADYCIINVLRELSVREIEQGYIGEKTCEEIFLPNHLVNEVRSDWIGKNVKLIYSVQGGKAYLDDIEI